MNKERNAEIWIKRLNLTAHPEGGYFNEVYRSDEIIPKAALQERYNADRNISTSIYFLLKEEQISHFHKLNSDEIWHFYDGSSLTIYIIDKTGILKKQKLGLDFNNGEVPQFTIPKECWFAAEVNDKKSFTLIGCTVAPGFDFADFQLGAKDILFNTYPDHKELINKFTL
jgi:uncharacterized protein